MTRKQSITKEKNTAITDGQDTKNDDKEKERKTAIDQRPRNTRQWQSDGQENKNKKTIDKTTTPKNRKKNNNTIIKINPKTALKRRSYLMPQEVPRGPAKWCISQRAYRRNVAGPM